MTDSRNALLGALLLAIPCLAHAAFNPGNMFIWDATWSDSDLLEYDTDRNFVRSYKAALPAGMRMSGPGHMAWGPSGHLYVYAEYLGGPQEGPGVFEWSSSGSLESFTFGPPGSYAEGFTVAPNGNFYLVDYNDVTQSNEVTEWTRDFLFSTTLAILDPAHSGDAQAVVHGGSLFVVGNHDIAVYDVDGQAQIGWLATSEDNDRLAVSADGVLAVNYQWHNPALQDYVELLDTTGAWLADATMPELDWSTRGMGFDNDGKLHVVGEDRGDGGSPLVAVFGQDHSYLEVFRPAELRNGSGNIIFAPVPLPPAVFFLVTSLLSIAVFGRRRVK